MKEASRFLLIFVLAFVLYSGCKKEESARADSKESDQSLINFARKYFRQQTALASAGIAGNSEKLTPSLREESAKTPLWDKAYIDTLSIGKAVVVPLKYEKKIWIQSNFGGNEIYLLDNIAKLLIYKDRYEGYHAEVVTLFPDSSFTEESCFSGIIRIEDWAGNFISEYKYAKGSISKLGLVPGAQKFRSGTIINDAISDGIEPDLAAITVCYSIEEYNYSEDDPDNGVSSSEDLGCDTYFYVDGGGGASTASGADYGSLGGGGGNTGSSISLPGGDNVIANINDYIKCFTNIAGNEHLYQVTVCVDQPDPGTRQPWGFTTNGATGSSFGSNPVDVGHTFLIFTETSGSGTITRNVGFYPQTTVNPYYPTSQGQLNNDAGTNYNISLTVTLTNGQFFNMLNYITQGNNTGYLYNLNTNNCTSFALHALNAGDVDILSTTGSWPGGVGEDPGDLGEDIRSMNLSSDMTRNTAPIAHPNLGSCVY